MKKLNYEITSAEIVASIENLLIEILLQLPIRSLLRFKSVSKQWLSLITDSQFCRRHNSKLNPAVGLFSIYYGSFPRPGYISFFPHESNKWPTLNYSFAVATSSTSIVDSCNGLQLCACYSKTFRPHWILYVYNPTTNQSCQLPELDFEYPSPFDFNAFLAFDPVKSFHYSVVCVSKVYDLVRHMSGHKIFVYSSESGAWKIAADLKPTKVLGKIYLKSGVYWNGSIHWIAQLPEGRYPVKRYSRFSLDHQVLEEMPTLPGQGDDRRGFFDSLFYLGQSCDHLHYINYSHHTIGFNVYELRRDYSEWFVKYRVDLSSVPGIFSTEQRLTIFYGYSISCMVRDGHKKGSFLILKIHRTWKVIKYNLDDKFFEHLYEVENPFRPIHMPLPNACPNAYGIPYTEPLASLAELL